MTQEGWTRWNCATAFNKPPIMKIKTLAACLLAATLISLFISCSFKKIGSDVGEGLSTKSDTIAAAALRGAINELTTPQNQQKIRLFLDSVVRSATDTLTFNLKGISDSILKHKILVWADSLVDALTGDSLLHNVEKIQTAFIGKTTTDVQTMKNTFHELLDEILSSNTKNKLGDIRSELLGEKTRLAVTDLADIVTTHIVDSAIDKLARGYKEKIGPQFNQQVDFIKDNANALLLTIGGIAAGLIVLVWRSRTKFLRLTTLLTKHINAIPDQNVYDKVTAKIKDDAITTGLEESLRGVLQKNGLLGTEAWKAQKAKLNNSNS